jgi:hypothetical protein
MVGKRKVRATVRSLCRVLVGLPGLAFAAAAGCGGQSVGTNTDEETSPYDCAELCEKGKQEKCPGAEALRCEDQCLGEDFRVEGTGCRAQRNVLLNCMGKLENICRVQQDCDDEIRSLWDCYRVACEDNDAEYCDDIKQ